MYVDDVKQQDLIKNSTTMSNSNTSTDKDTSLFVIKNRSVMKSCLDIVDIMLKQDKITLVAQGINIPNAVAVANILSETMLKDNIKIEKIIADSLEPVGFGKMTSVLKIILTKI